jgi:hypothetical protein
VELNAIFDDLENLVGDLRESSMIRGNRLRPRCPASVGSMGIVYPGGQAPRQSPVEGSEYSLLSSIDRAVS